jgi:hypothetical protein
VWAHPCPWGRCPFFCPRPKSAAHASANLVSVGPGLDGRDERRCLVHARLQGPREASPSVMRCRAPDGESALTPQLISAVWNMDSISDRGRAEQTRRMCAPRHVGAAREETAFARRCGDGVAPNEAQTLLGANGKAPPIGVAFASSRGAPGAGAMARPRHSSRTQQSAVAKPLPLRV